MTVKSIKNSSKLDSDDDDDDDFDESDESMQVDLTEDGAASVSDDNSSVDLVTQPSKKKKFN